jgi:hypothetical protein
MSAQALGVLLPRARAQEHGWLVVGVVDVIRRVYARADAEVRVAETALLDVVAVQVVNPPSALELDAYFSLQPVHQRSNGLARSVVEAGPRGVDPFETAECRCVENPIIFFILYGCFLMDVDLHI